jgi:hypothetical protein
MGSARARPEGPTRTELREVDAAVDCVIFKFLQLFVLST